MRKGRHGSDLKDEISKKCDNKSIMRGRRRHVERLDHRGTSRQH